MAALRVTKRLRWLQCCPRETQAFLLCLISVRDTTKGQEGRDYRFHDSTIPFYTDLL